MGPETDIITGLTLSGTLRSLLKQQVQFEVPINSLALLYLVRNPLRQHNARDQRCIKTPAFCRSLAFRADQDKTCLTLAFRKDPSFSSAIFPTPADVRLVLKQGRTIGPEGEVEFAARPQYMALVLVPNSANLLSRKFCAKRTSVNGISPISPIAQPSPLSGTRSDDELKDTVSTHIYGFRPDSFKRGNNQSTTSLSSAFTDAGTSSFSSSAVSPTGPFAFSLIPPLAAFSHQITVISGGADPHFQRPRSQTFPTLDIECLNGSTSNPEPATPNTSNGSLHSNTVSLSANHLMSPPSPRGGSSASSPTLEDARKGLDVALNYVQKSVPRYEEKDLMAVIRFFEGVGLRQCAQNMKGNGTSMQSLSGLSRIPEGGEVEMTNAPPTTSAKLETMMV
ncbi:unnamed protein product [Parascedosporium putredinis]|uniref:Uncharacterized protein n=1 Tax=Parascedosporium putredinis TaxID=1442378 RepID=A0A9P1H8F0_9PEZI|nr:unnamed protein product [Parascedosporium putredinis]CAI8000826.1 unnamed protein product [Parascedosporium putredinis]